MGHVLFNPAAENVLASASGDLSIKLWDIEAGSAKLNLKLGDIVQSLSWSADGSLLVTTSRDKKLRIWDCRQQRPAQEVQSHAGAKTSRAVWMGEHDRVATTGFSRMSDRQLALWDIKAPREPVSGFQVLDSISGVCMPFWDDGTQCLYLAGKGDGNIRYYEYENDKFEYLSEYKSADPQRGVAFMPRRGLNMHDNEVMRAYKTVNDSYIEPISFIVPRRAETFQEDIYPPAMGTRAAMSSGEWFGGKTALPAKVDMETLYDGGGMKEVAAHTPSPAPEASSSPSAASATATAASATTASATTATATTATATSMESTPYPEGKQEVGDSLRSPPVSTKDPESSTMSIAERYAAKDRDKEQSSDESSFEEVQKPEERDVSDDLVTEGKSEHNNSRAVSGASGIVGSREEEQVCLSGIYQEDTPISLTLFAWQRNQTYPSTDAKSGADVSTDTQLPGDSADGDGKTLEGEVKDLKSMMAQQRRQMAAQEQMITDLVGEMKNLKAKMG